MAKKLFWLKLQSNFFNQPKIKKLRRLAGGDTYTIIYLKLQLLSLENNGVLIYEGIEKTFAEELSLIIDENDENIQVVLNYLISQGLLEEQNNEYMLLEAAVNMGSESDSAKRVREFRKRKNGQELSQNACQPLLCNGQALQSNSKSLPSNSQALLGNNHETGSNKNVTTEIEIEKEIEIDREYRDIQGEYEGEEKPPAKPAPVSLFSEPIPEATEQKAAKTPRHSYGEYGWVKLTHAEYQRLQEELGHEELERCIRYIDESAETTGNKNKWKNWNLVLRKCSREGWAKPQNQYRKGDQNGTQTNIGHRPDTETGPKHGIYL